MQIERILTAAQFQALDKAQADKEAYGEFESESIRSQDPDHPPPSC
jgi:hypothetical protein